MSQNATMYRYLIRGQLRNIHIVTEYRDQCVYRTRGVGYAVMSSDAPALKPNAIAASVSTRVAQELSKQFR